VGSKATRNLKEGTVTYDIDGTLFSFPLPEEDEELRLFRELETAGEGAMKVLDGQIVKIDHSGTDLTRHKWPYAISCLVGVKRPLMIGGTEHVLKFVDMLNAAEAKGRQKQTEEQKAREAAAQRWARLSFPAPPAPITVPYIVRMERTYWEGDGMRPGDNIRSGVFPVAYIRRKDAQKIKGAVSPERAVEIITGLSWGNYCCDIGEAAEDGDEAARVYDATVSKAVASCFSKVVFEKDGDTLTEEPLPEGDWAKFDTRKRLLLQCATPPSELLSQQRFGNLGEEE
jgi:hypothetical protein